MKKIKFAQCLAQGSRKEKDIRKRKKQANKQFFAVTQTIPKLMTLHVHLAQAGLCNNLKNDNNNLAQLMFLRGHAHEDLAPSRPFPRSKGHHSPLGF